MNGIVAQPQASRAGLITAIVVSFVLNGLLLVGYFKQSNETLKREGQVVEITKKYAQAVPEPVMGSPEYNKLKDQAQAAGNASVYEVLSGQRSDLAVLVVGQPMSSPEVAERAERANRQANLALQTAAGKAELPVAAGASLVETLGRWPAVVNRVIEQREQLKRDAAASDVRIKAAESAHVRALTEKDQAIADARAEVARVNEQLSALRVQHSKALGDVQAAANQGARDQSQQLSAQEVLAAQKERENADLRKQVVELKLVLRKFKANPLTQNIVRARDGRIKAVAGNECFINLGKADQIPLGMTFEVYDSNKGIPALSDGPAPAWHATSFAGSMADSYAFDLPKGKGSIEVVSVGPDHTAQCRVVHVEPGQLIGPGDLIANLVYDRNVKFNFFVYGDFDLGRNGGAHGNDINVIRRLIEQWGGQARLAADAGNPAQSVSPDMDFLVVGKEPQMPNYSAEDLRTPGIAAEADNARMKLEAYRAVLVQAAEYGIPVLNQNRFLYYTGFFDQAKR